MSTRWRAHWLGRIGEAATSSPCYHWTKERCLSRRHLGSIIGEGKEVAVAIQGHRRGAMAHLRLDFLEGLAPLNQPAAKDVPQRVQAVLAPQVRFAVLVQPGIAMLIQHGLREPSRDLRRAEAPG